MTAGVLLIWDYDTALGQVNATYPYNFREQVLLDEIENVETILKLGAEFDVRMTFACVGFAAEAGHFPYHVPQQIAKIGSLGHEVASHSWRHEWLPYLEREQVNRTLVRSKSVLETCTGGPVGGFVPPFSRPMTWYRHGSISLGDRVFGPWYPGGNITSICRLLRDAGYDWCRVAYQPFWRKLGGARWMPELLSGSIERVAGIACIPHHCTGFDERAQHLVASAVEDGRTVVLVGHPSGLTRTGAESLSNLKNLLALIAGYQQRGVLRSLTVRDYLAQAK
jgi:hypothetical protein